MKCSPFTDRKDEGSQLMAMILLYKLGLCSLTEKWKDWCYKREKIDESEKNDRIKNISENLNFSKEVGQ